MKVNKNVYIISLMDVSVDVIIANGWHYFNLKEYAVRESSLFEQRAVIMLTTRWILHPDSMCFNEHTGESFWKLLATVWWNAVIMALELKMPLTVPFVLIHKLFIHRGKEVFSTLWCFKVKTFMKITLKCKTNNNLN